MNIIGKMRRSMAFNIIGGVVLLMALLGVVLSALGFLSFRRAFKKEYATSTYHMADTAATLVNGDRLSDYLEGREAEEYEATRTYLDTYCKKMSVSLIYVIMVDRSDYGSFVSVFNSVDNTVDDSSYTAWELGFERRTTNDEYRKKYKAVYDKQAAYETVYRPKPTDGQHPHITTMVPVKNSAGDVAAILCVQRPMRELADAARPYLISGAISTALLALLASLTAAAYLKKRFVKPIERVSAEATRFAGENTPGQKLGDMGGFREIADLASSIDKMEEDMTAYIADATAAAADKERITAELSLAASIQENSIPNDFPAFPDRDEFDIFASMTPAKEVGGDFYNFFMVDGDRLAFVIGDVSGKGIPAALFMMVTNILISDRTKMGGTPGEIMTFVNDNICEHNKAEMFVTLWLGILDLKTGVVTFANAGHDDAAVCRAGGEFEFFKTKRALVVGAMPGIKYADHELRLGPGDKLFLYTDGLPEACDNQNALFGLERMLGALNECRGLAPEQILKSVYAAADAHANGAPQFDDLTMLCLEFGHCIQN